MTNRLRTTSFWIRILLWIGVDLFLLLVVASTLASERALPAVGLSEPVGFIIRAYGIFQLRWGLLFFLALKDVERNLAIIAGTPKMPQLCTPLYH